ncbi:MAG: hypothetical protein R2800_03250 [Flavipsychrobacter sp.]
MKTSKNTIVITTSILTLVAFAVAFYLYVENRKKKESISKLEEENHLLEANNLKLILDSLNNTPNISDEIKRQLKLLIDKYKNIDKGISNELAQALQLIQIGQPENAIEDLVKIMEHLLKKYYSNNKGFHSYCKKEKKNASRPHLHDLLTYCQSEKKISEIEYKFFIAIKEVRNKEDHTIDLKLENYLTESGIITAMGAIMKISMWVYPNKQISENKNN